MGRTSNLKILFIADGSSVHTRRWLSYFAKRGHVVHLATDKPMDMEGVSVHLLPRTNNRYWRVLKGYKYIKSYIDEIKPDLIHAHYLTFYGWLGAASGFHPFVLTAWGSDILISPRESWVMRRLARYTLARADLVTSDGEQMKIPLTDYGLSLEKLQIIYFGVDVKKFAPGIKSNKSTELGLDGSEVVISLRSLKPIYDISTLVKAAPLVLREVSGTKFLVLGDGPQNTELKELAKSLGVEGAFRFVGAVPHEDIPDYLRLADVYVSTSLSDSGLSLSTAEAMACGLPVVITNNSDNSKWVKDNVNGFLIPPQSPQSLALKLIILLKDHGLRSEFGLRNRKIIETRNDYYKEMDRMEKMYMELVSRFKS